MADKMSDLVI